MNAVIRPKPLVLLGIVSMLFGHLVSSEVRVLAEEPPEQQAEPAESGEPLRGFQLQDLDDPVAPLEPKQPRKEDEEKRLDAVSWYMTGQLREARNDFRGALEAYRKAIETDPEALAAYQSLVPLAFSLEQTEEAIKYAMQAVELDPDDYQLLRRLGVHMATQQKFDESIKLFEQASRSDKLDKQSAIYLTLMRDLAVLYTATENAEKAADCYEVVFEALKNPQAFGLNPRIRSELLADPNTSYERIGQAFLDADRPEAAIQAFERAAAERRGKPGTLSFNLAQVYFQTKQFQNARTELQKYFDAQLQSKGRAAYELLAKILDAEDKSDDLIPQLEMLVETDSRNSHLLIYLAEQYVDRDRLDDAEELYTRAIKGATDGAGYVGLSSVYRKQGRAEELLDALVNAVKSGSGLEQFDQEMKQIAADESLIDKLLAVGAQRAEDEEGPELDFPASYILGKLAVEAKKTEAVLKFYRVALKDAGAEQAALVFEELGDYLLEARDFKRAAEVYQEAANHPALGGAKPNYLFRLSQALELSGQTEEALEAVEQARTIIPDHPLLHYQEGWIHYHSRQWDKAIEVFEQVIAKYPQNKEIVRRCQFSLSNIYVQQGNLRKGEEILEKILEEDPDHPTVNNDLGYLYADQGKNLEQARTMIEKALEAEPENAAYLDSMGWVLYRLEEYEKAIEYLKKAIENSTGGDSTIWDHLGDCHFKLNQVEQAVDAWQKALEATKQESHPDQELIEKIKQKLKEQGKPVPETESDSASESSNADTASDDSE